MPTRLIKTTPQRERPKAPERAVDWVKLLKKAISAAEVSQDRRLEGLKRALVDGAAEKYLRQMGIIHEGDLSREFPIPTPKSQ